MSRKSENMKNNRTYVSIRQTRICRIDGTDYKCRLHKNNNDNLCILTNTVFMPKLCQSCVWSELNCQIIITGNQYILYLKGVCRYVYLFFVWQGVSKTYLMQRSCTRLLIVIVVTLTGEIYARTDQIHGGYLWPKNMIELSGSCTASWLWHWLENYDTDAEAETWSFILPDHSIYLMFMCLYLSNYARTSFSRWLYHWNSRRSP